MTFIVQSFSAHLSICASMPLFTVARPKHTCNASVGALFPQASLFQPAVTTTYQEAPCVCACLFNLPKVCQITAPTGQPLILQSKSSIAFWMLRLEQSLEVIIEWPNWHLRKCSHKHWLIFLQRKAPV